MAYAFAGQWGPEPFGFPGSSDEFRLYPSRNVAIRRVSDGQLATLYTDRTKVTTVANPITTDAVGNAKVVADPGWYTAHLVTVGIEGTGVEFVILVDPEETAVDADVVAVQTALNAEITDRTTAVSGSTSAIATEASARATADTAEATARADADTAVGTAAATALSTHVTATGAHASDKIAFDNTSTGLVATEVHAAIIEAAAKGGLAEFGGGWAGEIPVDVGTLPDYVYEDTTLEAGIWLMGDAPLGQDAEFDVFVHPPGGGSASIFDVGNKPTIPAGTTTSGLVVPDTTDIAAGSYFTYDTTQTGGAGAGTGELVAGTVATYGDGLTNAPTSFPMPMPTAGSYQVGDLLVCVIAMGNTTTPFPLTVPSGWTSKALSEQSTTGHFVAVLWKVAGVTNEPGGTVTPSGAVNRPYAACTFAVRGVLTTDAVFDIPRSGVLGTTTYTSGSTATPTTASATTINDNDRGFNIYTVKYTSAQTPGNAVTGTAGTEICDIKTARVSQVNVSLHIYDAGDLGAAGTVTGKTVTLAAGTTWDRGIMFPLALKLSGVSGTPGADLTYRLFGR